MIMKRLLFSSVFFFIISMAFSQPWRLKEDFKIAFLTSYDDYICHTSTKGDKIHVEGFEKGDSLKKVFDYEASKSLRKDGYFSQYNKQGKRLFSMLFEDGIAKKLSVNFTDSTLGRYTLKNNLLSGQYVMYYSNGKIKEYGQYKDNAPIGAWTFYNDAGKVITEGNYCGEFRRLFYNVPTKRLITLNQFLDTVKSETLTKVKLDSLKKELNQSSGLSFPINIICKTGKWKFYDDNGTLIKEINYSSRKWEQQESH